jgi:enoyl-[acyl-carrier protein] reductase I
MTYLNDKTRQFTEQLAVALGVDGELYLPLDIQKPEQVAAMCATIQRKWGKLDVVLHAMAFAPMEALHAPVLDCPLDAFQTTMAVSVHSLIALSQKAVPLMTDGGSIFTLTYFGGDKVVPHYGIMGPAKSCLEGVVRYLAAELGPKRIRVNAISPGPLLTRAARHQPLRRTDGDGQEAHGGVDYGHSARSRHRRRSPARPRPLCCAVRSSPSR